MVDLYTQSGHRLGEIRSVAVEAMAANGRAPEVLSWGDRVFVLDANRERYVEGMGFALMPADVELAR